MVIITAIHSVSTHYLGAVRDNLSAAATKMLASYRRHCAAQIDAGQARA
jgi:hypothetical protein